MKRPGDSLYARARAHCVSEDRDFSESPKRMLPTRACTSLASRGGTAGVRGGWCLELVEVPGGDLGESARRKDDSGSSSNTRRVVSPLRASFPEPAAQRLQEAPGSLRRGRARRGGPGLGWESGAGRGGAEAEPGGEGPAAAATPLSFALP